LRYCKFIKNKILNIGVFFISINPRWPPYLVNFDKNDKKLLLYRPEKSLYPIDV